jgi:hypothetical protein
VERAAGVAGPGSGMGRRVNRAGRVWWAGWEKEGGGVWGLGFLFFFSKSFLNKFSNLLNQTFLHLFTIILKTFKASQQQNSCISKMMHKHLGDSNLNIISYIKRKLMSQIY